MNPNSVNESALGTILFVSVVTRNALNTLSEFRISL